MKKIEIFIFSLAMILSLSISGRADIPTANLTLGAQTYNIPYMSGGRQEYLFDWDLNTPAFLVEFSGRMAGTGYHSEVGYLGRNISYTLRVTNLLADPQSVLLALHSPGPITFVTSGSSGGSATPGCGSFLTGELTDSNGDGLRMESIDQGHIQEDSFTWIAPHYEVVSWGVGVGAYVPGPQPPHTSYPYDGGSFFKDLPRYHRANFWDETVAFTLSGSGDSAYLQGFSYFVPLPSTALLFGSSVFSLLGLGWWRRSRTS